MTTLINKSRTRFKVPKIIKVPLFLAWAIMLVIFLVSTAYYFVAQPELPIFYSLAQKSDQLAKKEFIFIFPLISLLMNVIHLLIIKTLSNYSALMLKLFVITTTSLQVVFLLALIRIVMITI